MSSEVQYYVIVAGQRGRAGGLARRTFDPAGPVDEALRRDLTWQSDSVIVEWEYGDLGTELVRVSEHEAMNLTQAFRSRWSGGR